MNGITKKQDIVRIQIEGLISNHWSSWFGDLSIQQVSDNETILNGELADQAALLGVLSKIHTLNLKIISVSRMPAVHLADRELNAVN
jgi:hypothetical protein